VFWQAWGTGVRVSVAELLLAFGVAELTPKNAIGQPGLMKALVQAQRGSLERAKRAVDGLRRANAALDDAIKRENGALACQLFHTNNDVAVALRAFVGDLSSLLPRGDELQALHGATGRGVTHVLGPRWGQRIERTQLCVPRHAVDSVLLHACRTSTPVQFRVDHPKQRSGPLWNAHMQPSRWGLHLAWHTDGEGTRLVTVGSPAACKSLAHRR
jgi:hypothetical protein